MDVISDADQFQDDEDEDWTETGWADPGALTVLPSKHTKQKPKPAAAHNMDIEIGEKKSDVVSGMALNDNKAGMAGLDREKINKIIMEASAGSKFYENEKKKEEQVKKRIDEQRKKLEKITEKQISDGEVEAGQLLQQLDSTRDLSRTIVHVDMDAFYAAAEMRDNPSLRDKPMAVGGNSMLSTSNYAARRYGVRAAMPGFIGKKLCPELVIVPLNFEKYTAISKQVRSVMADYDPNYCPMSLDEAYLDLTEHLKKRQTYTEEQRTFEIMDFVRQKINNKLSSAGENVFGDKGNEGKSREDSLASAGVSQYAEHVKKQRSVVNKECDGLEDMSSDEELDCLIRNIPNNIVDTGTNICEKTRKLLPEADCSLSKSTAVDHEERGRVIFGLSADEAVREMRFRIEQTTGLTASAGIAPNMMLAKVCSDKNKPNGQYRIPPTREAVLEFIKNLPIRKVMGIGKVSESMLKALNVTMCEHLYEKRAILYHLYSAISFNYFMRICIGIGSTKVERDGERKSMSVERTFNEINKPAELYKKCLELSEALAEDLKEENLKGRTVTIKMKTVAFEVKTRAQSLMEYTSDPEVIFSTAKEQLRLEIQASQPKPLRLRLLGVRMSNFQDSETSKKKQTTIKDMFQRAQGEKSTKTGDIVCVPIKEDAAEKMDENGNIVEAKSGMDVTSQVGRVADSLGGKTSAVRMAGDNMGQKCSDDGTHCGQLFAVGNKVFDDGVDQTSLDIIKLKVDQHIRDGDSDGPIHVSEDVDNDPVYLQDTDVDSDAECETKSSDMIRDLSEHTLNKPAEIVVTESENSCHKVCEDSERFVNQSGAKCEFSDLAPMKKESLNLSVGCDTCTKNSVTETYQVACDSSGPSDLNNNGPFDITRPNVGASPYGDVVLNSMIGRRGSHKVVVDTDLSEDADVSSSDTEVPKHCDEALTGPTRQTMTKVRESSCTVDAELFSGPSGQTGANEVRKVTSGAKKQEAFPCPVCNETIFCKDMIEFNRHLDNCLCGNSQPVSQNLRSQNSGVVKNKGKSLARPRKLKKGKVAKALGGKPSPSLNETLDRFMFKQEKSFSVHNFNEEESRDACDFLSYEESFAEEPTEFPGDILSDEDAPCESLKPIMSGESDADMLYTVTNSNLASTGVIPSRRLFAKDNVDLSKTEHSDFPEASTCKSSDISDCAIQLPLVTESESMLIAESSDPEQLVCKAPSSSGSQQITSATDETATMIESHINESEPESQPNNEVSAKIELVPAVDSSASSTPPKSGAQSNNSSSITGSQPTDGSSAALESSAVVKTSGVVETSGAIETLAAVEMSAAVKTSAFEPSAVIETAPLVEKSPVVEMSTAVETSAKSNPTTKPNGLLCPICNKTLRTKNLEKFNRHLDACLSGQSKREPKPRKRKASFGGRTSKRCKNDYSFEEWEEWE